jgi:hypothetical protein
MSFSSFWTNWVGVRWRVGMALGRHRRLVRFVAVVATAALALMLTSKQSQPAIAEPLVTSVSSLEADEVGFAVPPDLITPPLVPGRSVFVTVVADWTEPSSFVARIADVDGQSVLAVAMQHAALTAAGLRTGSLEVGVLATAR